VSPSAVPGGGLHPNDESSVVRICACGHPVRIVKGGRFGQVGQSLQQSLDAAVRYRESRSTGKILAELADTFVTWSEFQDLLARLGNLETLPQTRQEDQSNDKNTAPDKSKAKQNRL
jgi:hypothetical protein